VLHEAAAAAQELVSPDADRTESARAPDAQPDVTVPPDLSALAPQAPSNLEPPAAAGQKLPRVESSVAALAVAPSAISAPMVVVQGHSPVTEAAPARAVARQATVAAFDTPVVTASASPRLQKDEDRELNWGGFGLRIGSTRFTVGSDLVRAQASKVGQLIDAFGHIGASVADAPSPVGTAASGLHDFNTSVTTITPTLHLGGDGYFFKMEGILGIGPDFKTFGAGIYPINYGYFIRQASLFPYFSLGFAMQYLRGKSTDIESKGAILQGRAAVGVKWRILGWTTVSAELGTSAVAVGIEDTRMGQESATVNGKVEGVVGVGKAVDFSFGIEIL
jgi:hypothetical protein